MKIAVFDTRPDEVTYIERAGDALGVEVELHEASLSKHTLASIEGVDGVSILSSSIDADLAREIVARGVHYLSTRSIGYDRVDVTAAREVGLRVAHSAYAPNAVAEFTVMLMLMTVRKAGQILRRMDTQDFSLQGRMGRQLSDMTVGIVGAGSIGSTVAKLLSSFGCRLLVHDAYRNPELTGAVEFVDCDYLLEKSDLISLHAPAIPENHHMIDAPEFARMKQGVFIVNTARGDLINQRALIEAIESGRVGGAGLDALAGDLSFYHRDHEGASVRNHELALLSWYPNVILTPHAAFYTEQVMSEMVENSLATLRDFFTTGESTLEVRP